MNPFWTPTGGRFTSNSQSPLSLQKYGEREKRKIKVTKNQLHIIIANCFNIVHLLTTQGGGSRRDKIKLKKD